MEVTTVSPSAISPTEGDDLCEVDVTSVAIHSVTLLIGLCGLAGNGAVLWLLSLKWDFILLIFFLAVTDFLFLLFTVPSTLVFLLEDVSCTPIMPLMYVSFLSQLSVASYYWLLFSLMSGSFVVFIDMLWKLCCRRNLPKRVLWLVVGILIWTFFTLITVLPTVAFLCPSHEQELCRVSLISVNAVILVLGAAPVFIFRTINFIKAMCGSQQQQVDRRGIVFFLIVLFILLLSLWNFLQQLGYIVVLSQVVFLVNCINGSIKPFICFLAGISWRHCSVGRCWTHCTVESLQLSLQRVFEESEENTPSSNDPAVETVI